jgi:RNA polymerase subunit RPABC4/transcription elongation factor Spt4
VGADWCGQCYTSLITAPVKPARPPLHAGTALQVVNGDAAQGAVALMGDIPPPPPPPPGTIPPPPAPPGTAANKLRVARQPWPCSRCETVNEYEQNTCTACGRGFLDALAEPAAELPIIGAIDGSTFAGKLKIGLIGFAPLVLIILVLFTIAGFVLK